MLLRSTTASISCVGLGWLFPFIAVVLDALTGIPPRFRPLLPPGNLGFSALFVGISFTIEMKVLLLNDSFGPSVRSNSNRLCPRLTPANPSQRLSALLALQGFFPFCFADRQISPGNAHPVHAYDRRIYVHAFRISLGL